VKAIKTLSLLATLVLFLGAAMPAQANCFCTCCKPLLIGHSGSCSFVCFLTGSDCDNCYYGDCYQTGCN
jgi:hypothetical protein